jgi:hypothetical protein
MVSNTSYYVVPDKKPFIEIFTCPKYLYHILELRLIQNSSDLTQPNSLDSLPQDLFYQITAFLVTPHIILSNPLIIHRTHVASPDSCKSPLNHALSSSTLPPICNIRVPRSSGTASSCRDRPTRTPVSRLTRLTGGSCWLRKIKRKGRSKKSRSTYNK